MIGEDWGPILEEIILRTKNCGYKTRIIGLSATLPNYENIADFI